MQWPGIEPRDFGLELQHFSTKLPLRCKPQKHVFGAAFKPLNFRHIALKSKNKRRLGFEPQNLVIRGDIFKPLELPPHVS